MGRVRIGCSGWNYADWREVFYPKGVPARRWLEHYATVFDTVEVNATFYRLPRRATAERWAAQVPPGFCFAIKASRYLTHIKRLGDIGPGIERVSEPLAPLRERDALGPLLWQLPEAFRRDDDRLARTLDLLPPGRHAFEFRHASWLDPAVDELLMSHGATRVIAHDPRRDLPTQEPLGGWAYVRLHHGERGRRGNYSATELERWAQRLGRWRRSCDVYVYLNNDWEAFAPANARTLARALADDTDDDEA